MGTSELRDKILSEIERSRDGESTHLDVDVLESILRECDVVSEGVAENEDVETQSKDQDCQRSYNDKIELWKAELEQQNMSWRATIERENMSRRADVEAVIESFRSTIAYSHAALRSAILINGGGAVALLAFVGNVWKTASSSPLLPGLANSLWWYVVGVLVASIAIGVSYMAQGNYTHAQSWKETATKESRCGHLYNKIAVVLVIFSYTSFALASHGAYRSFYTTPNQTRHVEMAIPDPIRPSQPPVTPNSEPVRNVPSPVPNTAPPRPVQPPPPAVPPKD